MAHHRVTDRQEAIGPLLLPAGGWCLLISELLRVGKLQTVCYVTEPRIRKREKPQTTEYSLEKTFHPEPIGLEFGEKAILEEYEYFTYLVYQSLDKKGHDFLSVRAFKNHYVEQQRWLSG